VIHVFPNPSKDEFIIDLPSSNAETIIRLTNLQGKLLSTQMVNGSSFKFGKDLKPGAYFIQVMQDNKVVFAQKIIKG
jgi:Secretion system C-terminal sorting domain